MLASIVSHFKRTRDDYYEGNKDDEDHKRRRPFARASVVSTGLEVRTKRFELELKQGRNGYMIEMNLKCEHIDEHMEKNWNKLKTVIPSAQASSYGSSISLSKENFFNHFDLVVTSLHKFLMHQMTDDTNVAFRNEFGKLENTLHIIVEDKRRQSTAFEKTLVPYEFFDANQVTQELLKSNILEWRDSIPDVKRKKPSSVSADDAAANHWLDRQNEDLPSGWLARSL